MKVKTEADKKSTDILVVRQHNQIGDMLCSLTLYKAIKTKYPDSQITLVAAKTNYEIPFFDINPYIDRVLIFDKSSVKAIFNFLKNLRDRKYTFGFVPSTIKISTTSHIINFISGAKNRVGVKSIDGKVNKSHILLNVKSDFLWKNTHQSERNLQVANLINCNISENSRHLIKLNSSDSDLDFAKNFISSYFPDRTKNIVALHPGAGKKSNTWDSNNYIKLIKDIYTELNCYILITSGPTDEIIINHIHSELTKANIDFMLLTNTSIKKLAAILPMVDLYITNDTGTMHIAGYSCTKMVALFGPTNPLEWAPKGNNQNYIKSATGNINDINPEEVFMFVKTSLLKNNR
ncbi:MAG: glycosyltransferase family 9 protein [Gammaproteobacteria bacterium]|nr:glycosyltransferase family 9 protein [Gammaproteobacteria bacterium]